MDHELLDTDGKPFPYRPAVVLCGCGECQEEERERKALKRRGIASHIGKPKSPVRLLGR